MNSKDKEDSSLGRNYSFYWSQSDVVALWLAYPLYGAWAKQGGNRTDAFGADPILAADLQPSKSGYSKDSDNVTYSKGHQIPSADRISSDAINETVFYMTNMTPQIQSFNGGLWNTLETKVRSWAKDSDEFYVVTGCLVSGSKKTVTSNGLTVTVPTHYYKALLRKVGSTWTACAFIYEHFTSQSDFSVNDVKSIDYLEQQTGVDFFPNLEGVVGTTEYEKIERTATKFSSN